MLDVALIKERLQTNLDKNSAYITQSQDLPFRKAAVLIALFDHNDETYVVLTKRSENLRTHSGEVCFPGGKQDYDEDCITTALREAREEIGLDPSHVTVIGNLAPLFTYSKLAVTAVVGIIHDLDEIKLTVNDDEVSHVFACPLRIFLDGSCESSRDMQVKNREIHIHYFHHEFRPISSVPSTGEENFLSAVLGGPAECQYKIFGLTAKFAIAAAVICLNQPAVLGGTTYTTEDPQGGDLEQASRIAWASQL